MSSLYKANFFAGYRNAKYSELSRKSLLIICDDYSAPFKMVSQAILHHAQPTAHSLS